ncbi:hypothetical protein EYF80_031532 [Liparis tanakae]|uniref:Uncharacterized protein n=1 Tax=Liparis tanakae TaxID=230148 RepID=A0A4Z2GY83_9TELE|nr:hypothetical protein EYF80_031532 [Liparis tanakae]
MPDRHEATLKKSPDCRYGNGKNNVSSTRKKKSTKIKSHQSFGGITNNGAGRAGGGRRAARLG